MSGEQQGSGSGRQVARRALIAGGLSLGAGAAVALAGCGLQAPSLPGLPDVPRTPRERASCVARSSLTGYRSLADLALVYEVDQRRTSFAIEPGFAGQIEGWLIDLQELTGWRPDQVWTYGTWTEGGRTCSSWHDAGRAFDLARLRLADGTFVSARYDRWRDLSGARLIEARRAYWAVAASAHKHVAYVLTYLYDDQHHNHIHLDNGRSGSEPSRFSARSGVQVQAVQAICRYLWDRPVELTGAWDRPTRDAVAGVLAELDLAGDLTDQATWSAYLTASARRGAQPA